MNRGKLSSVIAWILSVVFSLFFLLAGIPKVLGAAAWVARFSQWGYPRWFLLIIGTLEVAGAILLVIPRLAIYGTGILLLVMVGAIYTDLSSGHGMAAIRPAIFFCFLALIAWLRRPRSLAPVTERPSGTR